MKKLIVMGIVAMMVMGLSVAASAAIDTDWAVQLRAMNGTLSMGTGTFGTKVGANDAFTTTGAEDANFPSPTATWAEVGSTIGGVSRISKDYRAPLDLVNFKGLANAKVWNLSLSIQGGTQGPIKLIGWLPTAAAGVITADADQIVELRQGDVVLWAVPKGVGGTSTAPQFTKTDFAYDGANPIALQLVAYTPGPIVPEPGSMVAMFSGLVGLAGFAIRRRK